MSRRNKSLRKRLLRNGQSECFYCGLPFNIFQLPKGFPGSVKAKKFCRVTLEHLQALSNNGETAEENCFLAHTWCNTRASNLSVDEKLALKKELSNNNGTPPWWPVIKKLIDENNRKLPGKGSEIP